MKIPNGRQVEQVTNALLLNGAKRATKYSSENSAISAQRVLFNGKIDRRNKAITIVLKIGQPNYLERKFIKQCQKVGEPFPVKKIQLKFPIHQP